MNLALIPTPSSPRETQALDEFRQRTPPEPIAPTRLERQHSIIDQDAHIVPPGAATLQFLKVGARGEGHRPRGGIPMGLRGGLHRSVGEWIRAVVEAHGAEDRRHVVVVAEVGVKGGLFAEGESGARRVQGVIG